MTLRFTGADGKSERAPRSLPERGTGSFRLPEQAGDHIVWLQFWWEPNGDAFYAFRVRITPDVPDRLSELQRGTARWNSIAA